MQISNKSFSKLMQIELKIILLLGIKHAYQIISLDTPMPEVLLLDVSIIILAVSRKMGFQWGRLPLRSWRLCFWGWVAAIRCQSMMQGQFHKGSKLVAESKDKVLSMLHILAASVSFINNQQLRTGSRIPHQRTSFLSLRRCRIAKRTLIPYHIIYFYCLHILQLWQLLPKWAWVPCRSMHPEGLIEARIMGICCPLQPLQ